jgi:hypothetical protein
MRNKEYRMETGIVKGTIYLCNDSNACEYRELDRLTLCCKESVGICVDDRWCVICRSEEAIRDFLQVGGSNG